MGTRMQNNKLRKKNNADRKKDTPTGIQNYGPWKKIGPTKT